MSVGICIACGADLDACGERQCDCERRPRSLSRLAEVVAVACADAAATGRDLRAALRQAARERAS